MQTKIIELKQAPVVLVEKPNEDDNDLVVVSGKEIFYNGDYFDLPKAGLHNPWKVLGILPDLTEEQFAECVADNGNGDYKNYVGSWGGFEKAKDSFQSLLESENVYTENPYGEKAPINNEFYWGYLNDLEQWQEAQSRTIDPKRTLILLKS